MNSKIRRFDSQGTDAEALHRFSTCAPMQGIHAIGNGQIMSYGRGPELMQLFGPNYSSPNMLSMVAIPGERMTAESHRIPETHCWQHELSQGTLIDLAPREIPCWVRHWTLNSPVRFLLDLHDLPCLDNAGAYPGHRALLITAPAGSYVYNDYPLLHPEYMQLVFRGDVELVPHEQGFILTLRGSGEMILTAGESIAQYDRPMHKALETPFEQLYALAQAEDQAFLKRGRSRRPALKDHPLSGAVEAAVQDVAFLIRAQQSVTGGVQAGHNYHLAYVRDQYGVFRGLLRMGFWEEAKAILKYYREIFRQFGKIANAQAMGVPGIFHVHEYDGAEITGYLLRQGLDMLAVTQDSELFRSLLPMLDWALLSQMALLHHNMLPFNGDETYIAGRILPRSVIAQGSFESTMMLIEGGMDYLDRCADMGLARPFDGLVRSRLLEVKTDFGPNFRRGQRWITNSLKRLEGLVEPEYRPGVCANECGSFGWNLHVADGRYLCPACAAHPSAYKPEPPREYSLSSTYLMSIYTGSRLIDIQELKSAVAGYLSDFRTQGRLPSRPDGDTCLGYDYGLLLYAAAQCGLEADDVLTHMLNLQDETGAWVEYYRNGQPVGTKCRPWESGICIEGALAYLQR